MTVSRTWGGCRELLGGALACGLGGASTWGRGAVWVALLGSGCATRDATASALTTAGAAAVIVGATMAADAQCYQASHGGGQAYCSPGLSRSTRNAGTALAIAGVGAAAAGYALQPKGPDRLGPAPAPRAPTRPYRLLRRPAAPEAAGGAPSQVAPERSPEVVGPEAEVQGVQGSGAAARPVPPRVEAPGDPAPVPDGE